MTKKNTAKNLLLRKSCDNCWYKSRMLHEKCIDPSASGPAHVRREYRNRPPENVCRDWVSEYVEETNS